jgi:hypothetical protein
MSVEGAPVAAPAPMAGEPDCGLRLKFCGAFHHATFTAAKLGLASALLVRLLGYNACIALRE